MFLLFSLGLVIFAKICISISKGMACISWLCCFLLHYFCICLHYVLISTTLGWICYSFHSFFNCLAILNISCFLILLFKTIYFSLSITWTASHSVLYSFMYIAWIFYKLSISLYYLCNWNLYIYSLNNVFHRAKDFNFDDAQFIIFFPLWIVPKFKNSLFNLSCKDISHYFV